MSGIDKSQAGAAEFEAARDSSNDVFRQAWLWPHVQAYNRAIIEVVGRSAPYPPHFLHGSWELDTRFGDLLNMKLFEVILAFEASLIEELHANNVEGSIVEFGVFEGQMLGNLLDKAESIGMRRRFYGFDSFQGLSQPSAEHDFDGWKKGQLSAEYETTARNLRLSERPYLSLIKGWVKDSLRFADALAINPIAYARIDVDIYEPTVDCLKYLSNRLADRAILVFDDWGYATEKGESKAFFEWAPAVPHYRFEYLAQCNSRFYLRIHHR
jgi:hypothetical protein